MEEAQADLVSFFRFRGIDLGAMGDTDRAALTGRFAVGDPDTIGEQFGRYLDHGIDGFTINMPANGFVPGRVELLGQTLARVVG
jgi:alkanesulfonate monooxygenase SsuD/methylene tetrahydromethanopterin reductase-like flavin-dependent oxidoreductase (luciferase family)